MHSVSARDVREGVRHTLSQGPAQGCRRAITVGSVQLYNPTGVLAAYEIS
jgi:hypothetical protein